MELLQSFVRLYPYSAAFAWTGHKGQSFNYKYLEVQDKVVSAKDYDKARDQWKKEKRKIQ